MKERIASTIKKAVMTLQKKKELKKFKVPEILVEKPKEENHGDYSSNIALQVAGLTKKRSFIVAELLKEEINEEKPNFLEKVGVVKPGFINFFLSKEYLQNQTGEILKAGNKFGNLKIGRNKKVQVEFVSANPTGPLTVANTRGGPLGDVLGNVLEKAGFKVEKAYYINDYGNQILILGHSVLKDEKAEYKGDYIDYLHKKIKEKDPYRTGEKAAKIIVEELIKKTMAKLGIKYDEWFSESKLYKSGAVDKILNFLKQKGLAYEKEGALWFKSTKYNDNRDRVLVKQDGSKTYLAGDIAYHRYKFERKKFDKVINIWGADHYGDVPGLQAALEALGYKSKLDIILLQFVTLLEKGEKIRMSKRKGIYVAMDELIDEVGSDVVRFFFLQRSADTHLNFDLNLAKEQSEKNPVFYVQYAYARICSILRKLKVKSEKRKITTENLKLLKHPSELALIKQLIRFPEIIEDTIYDYQVQRIPQYAIDLATVFHQFYRGCRVLGKNKELTQARLSLIKATKIVLKNSLDLMGISAPEKM